MGLFKEKTSLTQGRSAYSAAKREFVAVGFTNPGKPHDDMPVLSQDIGELADSTLMQLFQAFTEWTNYIATHVTKAEVDEDDAEQQLREAVSRFTVINVPRGERGVQRAAKERDLDPEIQTLDFEVRKRKAFRKMLATRMQNLERSTALISRELTRRTSMFTPQNRVGGRTA